MKHILLILLCMFGFSVVHADENAYYGVYRNAKDLYPIEKEFVMMLKPSNPDDYETARYAKFNATIIMSDKAAAKELDVKIDIVRSVVVDTCEWLYENRFARRTRQTKTCCNTYCKCECSFDR